MNKKFYIVFAFAIIAFIGSVILIQGCSKELDNLVTSPTASSHPVGWSDTGSAAFHGKYLFDKSMNLILCSPCHGADFKGGTSKASCYKCHTDLVVHPKAWYSLDSISSPGFHKNYLFNNHLNIAACKQCHGDDYSGGITQKSCYKCHDNSEIHKSSWLNPSDTVNFHGVFIRNNGWDIDNLICKNCHGTDYQGGVSQKTCNTCHNSGPKACFVCHGNAASQYSWPPKSLLGYTQNTQQGVGAHDVHLNPNSNLRISKQVQCSECHTPVNNYSDPNHIGSNPGTAEVVFGTLAKTVTQGFVPNPQWNSSTQKCSNVYCHGYFVNGNPTAQPIFNDPTSVKCGSCHGNPTTGDPTPGGSVHTYGLKCSYCHGSVIDSNRVIINKDLHVNGVVNYN